MRTIEEIDITKPIELEDFLTIFESQLPLTEEEKTKLREFYFPMYATFLSAGLTPVEAFEATKLGFYSQEPQIKERYEKRG